MYEVDLPKVIDFQVKAENVVLIYILSKVEFYARTDAIRSGMIYFLLTGELELTCRRAGDFAFGKIVLSILYILFTLRGGTFLAEKSTQNAALRASALKYPGEDWVCVLGIDWQAGGRRRKGFVVQVDRRLVLC